MMPLTMAKVGEDNLIKKIGGNADTRQFLENMGFIAGTQVSVVSKMNGNLIVSIKDFRVAISREMAGKIMV
jgi:ferrous iron transport protein A